MSDIRNERMRIKRYLRVIEQSLLFNSGTLDYSRMTEAITRIANAIHNYTEPEDGYMWEWGNNVLLGDLIPGAYWHFAQWHGGQSSAGYAALSALTQIFTPGMGDPVAEDLNGLVFTQLEEMAKDEQS